MHVPEIPPEPKEYPLMPLRDIVVFPTMVLPLFVGRNFSIKAVEEASKKDKLIFLTLQKDKDIEEPKEEDLHKVGIIAHVLRVVPIEENRIKVLVQGIKRGVIKEVELKDGYYTALVEPVEEKEIEEKDLTLEDKALMKSVKELLDKAISLGKQVIPDIVMIIRDLEDPGKLADLIASILEMKSSEAQEVLETFDPRERLRKIHHFLLNEVGLLEVKQQISAQAREQIEK